MRWNKDKRVYEDDRGKPIPPEKLREYIESYIRSNKDEIDRERSRMMDGLASSALITAFFKFLKDTIRNIHGAAGVIAYGGEEEMSPERWSRVESQIVREYEYLKGFETAVKESRIATDGIVSSVGSESRAVKEAIEQTVLTNAPSELPRAIPSAVNSIISDSTVADAVAQRVVTVAEPLFDTLIWGEVGSRARLYADATYGTYENSVKARESDAGLIRGRRICVDDDSSCEDCPVLATTEHLPLDEVADIGDSQCQTRCRCWLEFDYAGIEPLTIDRDLYA